jgi:hypothetical protein
LFQRVGRLAGWRVRIWAASRNISNKRRGIEEGKINKREKKRTQPDWAGFSGGGGELLWNTHTERDRKCDERYYYSFPPPTDTVIFAKPFPTIVFCLVLGLLPLRGDPFRPVWDPDETGPRPITRRHSSFTLLLA